MKLSLNRTLKHQLLGLAIAILAYVGVLAIVIWLIWIQDRYAIGVTLSLNNRSSWQSMLLAYTLFGIGLSPALLVLMALVQFFRKQDELQQQIQHAALGNAFFGGTLFGLANVALGIISDGRLNLNGLFPWILMLPIIGVSWLSGRIVAQWRYCPPE